MDNEIIVNGIKYIKAKLLESDEYEYLDGDGKWRSGVGYFDNGYAYNLEKLNYNFGGEYDFYTASTSSISSKNINVIWRKRYSKISLWNYGIMELKRKKRVTKEAQK